MVSCCMADGILRNPSTTLIARREVSKGLLTARDRMLALRGLHPEPPTRNIRALEHVFDIGMITVRRNREGAIPGICSNH
jgi:hypothetical protein